MGLLDFFSKQPKEPDWATLLPKEIADIMLSEIKSNPQACSLDELPFGTGLFGIERTNPIPVYGVPENEKYLSKLRLHNGERVRWRRVGSLQVKSIERPIDEYEIFNLRGDTITFLYLSPYHLKTGNSA